MKRPRWLLSLGIVVAIVVAIVGHSPISFDRPFSSPPTLAQTPPSPSTPPTLPPSSPKIPTIPPTLTPPPLPPASVAPPLPLNGEYQDPGGRFKVGVLKDYKISPLAGSVLIEAPDGNLAYSVVAQSQPLKNPIGLDPAYDSEGLVKVATAVFQRGEGFQPGTVSQESGGGVVINWTGTLTIAGNPQPIGGVILIRPSPKNILLLLIAATQPGANQVPGAVSALASTLQVL